MLRSPARVTGEQDKLYVVKSCSFTGTPIYTKGTFRREGREEVFYVLVSAKISTDY